MSALLHERFVRFLKAIVFTFAIVLCFGVMLSLIPNAGIVDALTSTSVITAKKISYETIYRD